MRSIERFKAVCSFDPAIDLAKCGVAKLREYVTSRDMKLVPALLRTGHQPMVFHLRPATKFHEGYILSATTDDERNQRAFAALCVHVDGFWTEDKRRVDKTFSHADSDNMVMTEDELMSVPWLVRNEIGHIAHTRCCFLVPWSEPQYRLPPGSVSHLDQIFASLPPADESRQSSMPESTESSSPASIPQAASTGVPSEGPTGATAGPVT